MKVDYLHKLPKFWRDKKEKYELILSDDLDSLLSCTILKQVKNWNINYFYTFERLCKAFKSTKEAIGVDIALKQGKCLDNHVTMLQEGDSYNEQSINLNVVDKINRDNYFTKYCGSTLLMIWSLYNIPLPKSDIGKMILLAIDGSFSGYYSQYERDNKAHKHYIVDVLGFKELYEVLERHSLNDFYEVVNQFNLAEKIKLDLTGYLYTSIDLQGVSRHLGIDIQLPTCKFDTIQLFKSEFVNLRQTNFDVDTLDEENIYSMALIGKNKIKYSTALKKRRCTKSLKLL